MPSRSDGPADLVVRGGTVVAGDDVVGAAVVVRHGRISALCEDEVAPPAEREFDASGKLVLPGAIDAHIHHRNFSHHLEDFGEVSLIAAHGGITTIIPFVVGDETMALEKYIRSGIEEGNGQSVLDFGLHFRIFAEDFRLYEQIPAAIALGAPSVKMVMGYRKRQGRCMPDDRLVAIMEQVARGGGITEVHAENGVWIDYLENKLQAAGQVGPLDFGRSRPSETEWDAIGRLIAMNSYVSGRLYFPHVSTRLGVEEIREARGRGQEVYAETCPQYLLLTEEELVRQGPLQKMVPPLRRREDTEALWQGIVDGTIQVVGSDHSPVSRPDKEKGRDNIFQGGFGSPGTETLFPLMYSEGVGAERITLRQLVRVMAEYPARIFGLYPRKGAIAVGSDADLLILDPDTTWEVRASEHHSVVDYSPYEGWRVHGRPIATFQRGESVLKGGQVRKPRGSGRFVPGVLPKGPLLP